MERAVTTASVMRALVMVDFVMVVVVSFGGIDRGSSNLWRVGSWLICVTERGAGRV